MPLTMTLLLAVLVPVMVWFGSSPLPAMFPEDWNARAPEPPTRTAIPEAATVRPNGVAP